MLKGPIMYIDYLAKTKCRLFLFWSYDRCFIWLKSACRVYYSYLRQVIHERVTSEVNIATMQMAVIFSLESKVWLMNDAVWQHSCF